MVVVLNWNQREACTISAWQNKPDLSYTKTKEWAKFSTHTVKASSHDNCYPGNHWHWRDECPVICWLFSYPLSLFFSLSLSCSPAPCVFKRKRKGWCEEGGEIFHLTGWRQCGGGHLWLVKTQTDRWNDWHYTTPRPWASQDTACIPNGIPLWKLTFDQSPMRIGCHLGRIQSIEIKPSILDTLRSHPHPFSSQSPSDTSVSWHTHTPS